MSLLSHLVFFPLSSHLHTQKFTHFVTPFPLLGAPAHPHPHLLSVVCSGSLPHAVFSLFWAPPPPPSLSRPFSSRLPPRRWALAPSASPSVKHLRPKPRACDSLQAAWSPSLRPGGGREVCLEKRGAPLTSPPLTLAPSGQNKSWYTCQAPWHLGETAVTSEELREGHEAPPGGPQAQPHAVCSEKKPWEAWWGAQAAAAVPPSLPQPC